MKKISSRHKDTHAFGILEKSKELKGTINMQIYYKKRLIGELSGAQLRILISTMKSSAKARYRVVGEELHCQNKTSLEISTTFIDEIK